jgi:hypothetical protein
MHNRYMAFSTVCYTIKLNIELALGKLILVLAQEPNSNIRISEHERSRYEDVLDPYSVRSLRSMSTGTRSSAIGGQSDSEKETEERREEIGIGQYRCGNCQATGSVVRRRKQCPMSHTRSTTFSSRDLESVDEIEVEYDYELRSEKMDWSGEEDKDARKPTAVYQVEINGNKAGENGQHPRF